MRMLATIALALAAALAPAAEPETWVSQGEDGRLAYGTTDRGDRLPDFSHAGYKGGGVALPVAPVIIEVEPGTEADDTTRLQAAIDKAGSAPLDAATGLRGAVLLKRGEYRVLGTLRMTKDGVVLRGEGNGPGGTVLRAAGTFKRPLIEVEGQFSPTKHADTVRPVLDDYIPVGATTLRVQDAGSFRVGEEILVSRPASDAWITSIGMDQIPPRPEGGAVEQWRGEQYVFDFERRVVAIDGETITIDIPLPQSFDKAFGSAFVSRTTWPYRVGNVGIESLRLVSDFAPGKRDSDEAHATDGIIIDKAQDCWVRDVTALHFTRSLVTIERDARFVTVQDCACLEAASRVTGGRRYSFYIIGSNSLVQRCVARDGRHDFVTGSRVLGPNAFVDCLAVDTNEDIGPHHRWAMGILFDNVRGGEIRVRNRSNRGSGHGWAGAQNVLWNCVGTLFVVQSPPGAFNWALGCVGPRRENEYPGRDGIHVSHGEPMAPRSLYLAQLADRLGTEAVAAIAHPAQLDGTINEVLQARLDQEPIHGD